MKTSPFFPLALAALFIFGELLLGVTLYTLQISNTADAREDQAVQVTRRIRRSGQRGRILDRNGEVLADCRPSHGIRCYLEDFKRHGASSNTVVAVHTAITRLGVALQLSHTVTPAQIARHLQTKSAIPLVVWSDVSDRTFARFMERAQEHPGFDVFTAAERVYPHGSLAAHVLGFVGRGELRGFEEDPVYYSEKELRGRDGLESVYNDYLVGPAYEERVLVDARGFRVGDDGADARPASVGLDLKLTLDLALQRIAEEQLCGLTGAVVALDPRDCAVLALASSPTFDLNQCVPRLSSAIYASLTNAPAKRGQNRALSESYAPGSTFKPITALAALEMGWLADDEYDCHGVYRYGDLRLHCSNRYGHGPIMLRDALKESCNSFFCNLGTAIGSNAVIRAAQAFGLGTRTGIDLPGETAGVVPDDTWKREHYGEPWYAGDTCQMSIGQGMLLVTPLQMAMVAATLANGGRIFRPYLFQRNAKSSTSAPVRKLPFKKEHIELVRLGMKDVADKGTGWRILIREGEPEIDPLAKTRIRRRFRLGVDCAGKTGTAEIGRGATKRKNTWIIAFAPFENPTIAVAMIVERGESGGKTVAPRVHNILAQRFGENEIKSRRVFDAEPQPEVRD